MKNVQTFVLQGVLPVNMPVVTLGYPYDNSPFAVYSHEAITPDKLNYFSAPHYVAIVEAVYKIVNVYIFEASYFAHNFAYTGVFINCATGWYLPANLSEAGSKAIFPDAGSVRLGGRVGMVNKVKDTVHHLEAYIVNTPFSDPAKEGLYKQIVAWFRLNRVKADVRFHCLKDGTFVLQAKRLYENGKMINN